MTFMQWLRRIFRPRPTPRPVPVPDPIIPEPGPIPNDDFSANLLDLHNDFRHGQGMEPLALNPLLGNAAQFWAKWMAQNNKMAHEGGGTTPRTRTEAQGYKPWLNLAENIAEGYTSATAVMVGWENSAGHRANILGPCLEVGFGKYADSQGNLYWCADFGTRGSGLSMDSTHAQFSGPLSAPR